jgi:glutamyl-tRNA synthetase
MLARGIAPRYSGKCRGLDAQIVKKRLAAGERSIIRLVMPAERIVIRDLIRGEVSFDASLIGDIAIAKNLHTPLYNFAVVIDDAEMQITHVLRGEDHLSNTPKQWVIAEALNLPHPAYGHFPLILGPDRSKLSKRHGATSVGQYRELGYLPEALINFIALLGWHPEGEKEIFSRDELIREFSLKRIQKAGAIFNLEKLDWLNGYYIRQKSDAELRTLLMPYWEKAGYLREGRGVQFLDRIAALEKERLKKLSDVVEATEYFFRRPTPGPELLVWKRADRQDAKDALEKIIGALREVPADAFTKDALQEKLAPLYGQDRGRILWPLRAALSGREYSPGPFEIAETLGKEETLARLEYAVRVL